MPMHDWSRVEPDIYHILHFAWIYHLNRELAIRLPDGFYAMPELRGWDSESEADFYLRKQNRIVIRHVTGHRIVAVIEVVSPGNKDSARAYRAFVGKARDLLERKVHLLVVDPIRGSKRQAKGLHFDIARRFLDAPHRLTPDQPLALASYECDETLRAYVEPFAVGDTLHDMPIYFLPDEYIDVPLEATYGAAFQVIPPPWRKTLEA